MESFPQTESYVSVRSQELKHELEIDCNIFENVLKLKKTDVEKIEAYNKFINFNWFNEVKILNSGKSFGELALMNDKPRAATIHTLSECYFAVLGRDDYQRFL